MDSFGLELMGDSDIVCAACDTEPVHSRHKKAGGEEIHLELKSPFGPWASERALTLRGSPSI